MNISPISIIAILVLGVLFFGKNLPGVAKKIGASLMEFRKGLDEWKEDYGRASVRSSGVDTKVSRSDVGRSACGAKEELEERFESLGTKFEAPLGG